MYSVKIAGHQLGQICSAEKNMICTQVNLLYYGWTTFLNQSESINMLTQAM